MFGAIKKINCLDKKAFAKKGFVFFLLFFVMDLAGVILMNIPHYQKQISEELPPGTVGMIFFRGSDPTGRFLRRDTLRRANKAIRLYRNGDIEMIACIGGARPGLDVYGSEMVKAYLVSRGIPNNKILVDRKSYDSSTNWRAIRELAEKHEWNHITLIASPMHNQRLRTIIAESPLHRVAVFHSPYAYTDCSPPMSLKELWIETHYEWLAYAAEFILPEPVYSRAIRWIR